MKPLGEVATLQRGFDLPVQDRQRGAVKIFAANGPVGTHNEHKVCGPGVVTGRSGSIGKVHFVEEDYWPLNTALWVKDFHGNDPRWVFRLLTWMQLEQFTRGVGVPTLNRNLVHVVEIPLPPVEEQKRIAGILDQADALRRLRTRALDKLGTLGQAIFHEMFGDKGAVPREPLGDLIEARSSLADPTLVENAELPHVGPEHIKQAGGVIEWQRVVSCHEDGVTSGKYRFEPSDVIYSKIRPYLNKVAIADRVGMCSADMYALLPKVDQINTRYLHAILGSAEFLAYGETVSGRANIPKMNRKQLMAFEAPLPSSALQARFEQRVETLDEETRTHKEQLGKSEALFASLQHRAFRGEL
jgi:type I restriction enzyme S subunit